MSGPEREGAPLVPRVRVVLGPRRSWSAVAGTRATGYAFRGRELLRAERLAEVVEATLPDALPSLFDGLTGSYAVVKETVDAVYAIVDPVRGIPLFCVDEDENRVVTDDPLHTTPGVRASSCDWSRRAELLKSCYVTGADTLLDHVHQVEAGSLLRIPGDRERPAETRQWYAFRPDPDHEATEDLVGAAYEAHRAAVDRLIRYADGSLVVVPLSAGLDSGILAALLARSGIDRNQVLAYTYGRVGSRESQVARHVAESFGLRWEFIPYSESTWRDLATQPWWPEYVAWASSLAGVPGFADIPAVLELRRRGAIPDGSIVAPGHIVGFVSGSFIAGSLLRRRHGSRSHVIDAVLATYYKYRSDPTVGLLVGRPAEDVADAMRERVDRSLPATPSTMSREQLVSLVDEWGLRERQAKLIVNGVRNYEHQDLQWAIPWSDREVLDFWARAPLRQRVGQRLRGELAELVGWPTASRSKLDRLEVAAERQVRMLAVDGLAKRLRNLTRRATKRSRYHGDPLASFALFGETRFLDSFHGTETPRAMLAEDLLESIEGQAPRSYAG